MADYDNSRYTYTQVLAGTGYYMKDDMLRYSAGVKTMQGKLNTAGHNCGTPDGKFGNGTDTAVKAFRCQSRDFNKMGAIYNGDGATYGPKLKANAADYAKA